MKKWITILLYFCMAFAMTACGQTSNSEGSIESTSETESSVKSALNRPKENN